MAKSRQSGFTIIEIVLVLAIAGLIFIIVFLALPQLQKSRRDTQRRKDVGRMVAALDTYASSSGTYPNTQALTNTFASTYLDDFNDPSSGSAYTITYQNGTPTDVGTIYYRRMGICNGGAVNTGTNAQQFAISMKLEGGIYCQDNQ